MVKRDILFLIYRNRSGSTFLANQLSRHPELAVAPEGHNALRRLLGQIERRRPLGERLDRLVLDVAADEKLSSWQLDGEVLRQRLSESKDELDAFFAVCDSFADIHRPGARSVVVKGYFLQALINCHGYARLERDRKVRALFMLRDPRAMFASQRRSLSTANGKPMQDNPLVATLGWRQAAHFARALSQDPFGTTIKYEDLVFEYAATLKRIAAFLEIDWAPLLSPESGTPRLADLIPENQRHLHNNIGQEPLTERIGSWETSLSPRELKIVELFAGPSMQQLGYVRKATVGIGLGDVCEVVLLAAAAAKRKMRWSRLLDNLVVKLS